MAEGRVKVGETEYKVDGRLIVGRTPDNDISFPEDSNISRQHAEIRQSEEDFFIADLGSSNGTKINGLPLKGQHKLANGDFIILGNSVGIVFNLVEPSEESDEDVEEESAEETAAEPEPSPEESKKNRKILAGAAGALGLAVIVGGGAIYMASGSTCNATAKIINPETGETITKATTIEVETENGGCIAKVLFTIDGVEFASSTTEPYEAEIDPKDHPDLADGGDHGLGIVLLDRSGTPFNQTQPVFLAFDTKKLDPPTTGPQPPPGKTDTAPAANSKQPSLVELQQMSATVVQQFPGNFKYNIANRQFLEEVLKRTSEYAQPGYFARAAAYRDQINLAFAREQNLPAPLGYYLAMSRSKFDPAKQGVEEGLFRMSNEFVTANGYAGVCGTETLSDPLQNCASKAAALYSKALVIGVFEGDVIFSAAAFGKNTTDAGVWKAALPANRTDFWIVVKTPSERDQLARFFAAAIVGENPQRFGLEKERPLSELYKLAQ